MDIKDRVKKLMDHEQMTAAAFADSIGVSQATISHTLGDRNKYPSTDFIMRLHNKYKYINLNWLITGEGEMINKGIINPSERPAPSLFGDDLVFDKTHETSVKQHIKTETAEEKMETCEPSALEIKATAAKKITEIRVFFDDNTYEIFKPEK